MSEVVSGSGGREGWIVGETGGATFRFYDLLHSTGRSRFSAGETHEFIVNALSKTLSYEGREFWCLPVSLYDGEANRPTTDLLVAPKIAKELGGSFDLGDELAGRSVAGLLASESRAIVSYLGV